MGIILITIALFGMTSIMGLYLSFLVLSNKEGNKAIIIIIHGLFSIAGFALLFSYFPESLKSIMCLSIATFFGSILLYQYLTGRKYTKWLCFAHAIMTIIGFVFLIEFAWQNEIYAESIFKSERLITSKIVE